MSELLLWCAGEKNHADKQHDIVAVNIAGMSIGDIKKPKQVLPETLASGCPNKLTDASLVVNNMTLGKPSLYQKVCQPIQSLIVCFHKNSKQPNEKS